MRHLDPGDHAEAIGDSTARAPSDRAPTPSARQLGSPQNFIGMKSTPVLITRDHVPRRTDQCNVQIDR
eukprot:scaffold73316_cov61-Phaeocystis_antarctica.AAC.1